MQVARHPTRKDAVRHAAAINKFWPTMQSDNEHWVQANQGPDEAGLSAQSIISEAGEDNNAGPENEGDPKDKMIRDLEHRLRECAKRLAEASASATDKDNQIDTLLDRLRGHQYCEGKILDLKGRLRESQHQHRQGNGETADRGMELYHDLEKHRKERESEIKHRDDRVWTPESALRYFRKRLDERLDELEAKCKALCKELDSRYEPVLRRRENLTKAAGAANHTSAQALSNTRHRHKSHCPYSPEQPAPPGRVASSTLLASAALVAVGADGVRLSYRFSHGYGVYYHRSGLGGVQQVFVFRNWWVAAIFVWATSHLVLRLAGSWGGGAAVSGQGTRRHGGRAEGMNASAELREGTL